MGLIRMTVEVTGPEVDILDPLEVKESMTLALDGYGKVSVLDMVVDKPEQQYLEEMAFKKKGAN